MLLSYTWLKKFVALPPTATPKNIAERLTLSTVEIEHSNDLSKDLTHIVVGRIIAVEKHPNADRLKVCTVDVGSEKLTIVCGGSNVGVGLLTAVAKIGASVRWHGEGDMIVLEPATIRGIASEGMMCGADEIGLSDRFPPHDEKEIIDLTAFGYEPGTPLATAIGLDDVIFEIDNKALSNRPDLWGHYGMARELATLYEADLAPYELPPIGRGKGKKLATNIQAAEACSRYMTATITNLKILPSPAWLTTTLTALNIRPINNIVDITNYVMLELGQPLHAFDAEAIHDSIINVRSALSGETIKLLDGKTYTLTPANLVIATPGALLALAGIMGAEESSLTEKTTSVILESAAFDATVIRSSAGKLNLRSDASVRFEKNLDPNLCSYALARAIELIKQLCPEAEVTSSPTDYFPHPPEKRVIEVPRTLFSALLGTTVPEAITESILTRLGFKLTFKKNTLSVVVPSWRATKDIHTPEDLVEEVIRMYGYTTIPAILPTSALTPLPKTPLRALEQACKTTLTEALRFNETPTYSFISRAHIEALGDDPATYLELANPLSHEKPYIRRSLLPNLLEAARFNKTNGASGRLFEIGKVIQADVPGELSRPDSEECLPRQDTYLALIIIEEENTQPFFEAKRSLEFISHTSSLPLSVAPATTTPAHHHPGRSAEIFSGTHAVGTVYELHPTTAKSFGLGWRVAIAELNLTILSQTRPSVLRAETLSSFPLAERDLAFITNNNVSYENITTSIRSITSFLTDIKLLDHYHGAHIPEGSKSLTLHLTFSKMDRTLTTEEIDITMKTIVDYLTEHYQITLR